MIMSLLDFKRVRWEGDVGADIGTLVDGVLFAGGTLARRVGSLAQITKSSGYTGSALGCLQPVFGSM